MSGINVVCKLAARKPIAQLEASMWKQWMMAAMLVVGLSWVISAQEIGRAHV